jgi:hypothetical protein
MQISKDRLVEIPCDLTMVYLIPYLAVVFHSIMCIEPGLFNTAEQDTMRVHKTVRVITSVCRAYQLYGV